MYQLGYSVEGADQGRPLVLIHGWGCDARFLKPIANMFSDRKIILIDLPGYGKSACLTEIIEDFPRSVQYLINTLPEECDLMSWSFGSLYALHATSICSESNDVAASEPLYTLRSKALPKIHSLVTICGSARFPSDPNWPGMSSYRILKCNTALTPRRLKMVLNMFYHMQTRVGHNEIKESMQHDFDAKGYIENLVRMQSEIDFNVLMGGIRLVTFLDERTALRHLKVPSLHLFGKEDKLVPKEVAEHFKNEPQHQVFVFPHSAHTPYLSEPELFEKIIRNFYKSLPR